MSNSLKNKMQTLRITFSNGTVGSFTGKACVEESELESTSIVNIELGLPEDITDDIRRTVMEQAKKDDSVNQE